jgi:hypothetical protein
MRAIDIHAFVAGVLLGFIANIAVGIWFSYDQFSRSSAGFRVKNTVEATQRIIDEERDRGSLRNKYRYSLGVIIDELVPADDINSSSFVGSYGLIRYCSKDVHQLDVLTKLCTCLENVVSELDSAFEQPIIVELDHENRIAFRMFKEKEKEELPTEVREQLPKRRERLRNAYEELFVAWRAWLRVAKMQESALASALRAFFSLWMLPFLTVLLTEILGPTLTTNNSWPHS